MADPPPPDRRLFDHERLEVYDTAIEFVVAANDLAGQLPKGTAHLADQLHRASISIPLNIAEGAGEYSRREKARFYRIARRSATECAATLDVCERLELLGGGSEAHAREMLLRIVAMLTRMVQRSETSGSEREAGSRTGPGS